MLQALDVFKFRVLEPAQSPGFTADGCHNDNPKYSRNPGMPYECSRAILYRLAEGPPVYQTYPLTYPPMCVYYMTNVYLYVYLYVYYVYRIVYMNVVL